MNMQYVLIKGLTSSLLTCVLSVPQSEETRAELSQIAWVPRQVGTYSSDIKIRD